jgi:hypothetical protein
MSVEARLPVASSCRQRLVTVCERKTLVECFSGVHSETYLSFSVEVDARRTIECHIAHEASFVARPREHREWHRDRDVDANLAHVHIRLELACSRTALSEDRSAIAVLVGIDSLNGVVQSVSSDYGQNGSKYLLPA